MKKKTVLIVDDDRELCQEWLEILEAEGYTVALAYDGVEGMRCVDNGGYDLVLLDLKMPGMMGHTLLRYIKHERPEQKVVVVTGHPLPDSPDGLDDITPATREDQRDALMLADVVMTKPLDVERMLATIEALVR